jgi:hypothetical protein
MNVQNYVCGVVSVFHKCFKLYVKTFPVNCVVKWFVCLQVTLHNAE